MAEFGQKTMFLNVSSVILFALLIGGVMTDWCLQYVEVSEGHYNFSCQNQNDCPEQSYKTESLCRPVQELYLNSSCNSNGTFFNASVINQLCSDENFTISCINFTVIEKTDICQPCHDSCSSCSGPGEKNCTECKMGYHRSFSPVTSTAISTSTTSTTTSSTIVTDVTDAYDNVTMSSSQGARSERGITDSYNETTNTTPMTTSSTTEPTTAAVTTGVPTIRQCVPCQDTLGQNTTVDHLVKKCTEWLKSGMPPVET
ncbi:cell wall integrity and stress response component 4-like [Lingula anatina]|uniref:Cell wall integrity and stress response component 4-like n=1 Tax=Lingula anatina TaxID=7574 RepID=A0A1S3K6G9_LINAN|nr:cell wall integrity and stress response component 4-like [Lingula anatina]|eukprot:XP_013418097.1 cell wall integrity and stress response component 4-like [Lingula anatina]